MSVKDIAAGLVDLVRQGNSEEAIKRYYSEDIVSIEAMGPNPESRGIEAIKGKMAWWRQNIEVHSAEVTGPYINGNQFAVGYKMDTTDKNSGKRSWMEEVAVYTVENDKITEERFLYLTA